MTLDKILCYKSLGGAQSSAWGICEWYCMDEQKHVYTFKEAIDTLSRDNGLVWLNEYLKLISLIYTHLVLDKSSTP